MFYYSKYGISFEVQGTFSMPNGGFGNNIIIIGADMRPSARVDMLIIKKDILILGKGPTKRLDDTTLTTEAEYSISFTKQGNKFCCSMRYSESNVFGI